MIIPLRKAWGETPCTCIIIFSSLVQAVLLRNKIWFYQKSNRYSRGLQENEQLSLIIRECVSNALIAHVWNLSPIVYADIQHAIAVCALYVCTSAQHSDKLPWLRDTVYLFFVNKVIYLSVHLFMRLICIVISRKRRALVPGTYDDAFPIIRIHLFSWKKRACNNLYYSQIISVINHH